MRFGVSQNHLTVRKFRRRAIQSSYWTVACDRSGCQILHRIKSGSITFWENPIITSHNGWNTLHLSWKASLEYEKPLLWTFLFIVQEHSRVKVRRSHIDFRFFQNTGNQKETQISESTRGIKSRTHKDKTKLNCQNQMKGYQSLQWFIRRKLRQHTLEVSSYYEVKTQRHALTKNLESPWKRKSDVKQHVILLWAQPDQACVFLAETLSLWNPGLEKQ